MSHSRRSFIARAMALAGLPVAAKVVAEPVPYSLHEFEKEHGPIQVAPVPVSGWQIILYCESGREYRLPARVKHMKGGMIWFEDKDFTFEREEIAYAHGFYSPDLLGPGCPIKVSKTSFQGGVAAGPGTTITLADLKLLIT